MTITIHTRAHSANVLIAVLVLAGVASIAMASVLSLTLNQQHSVARSVSWNKALPVAESGIEEALTHLHKTNGEGLGVDGWSINGDRYTKTRFLEDEFRSGNR